MSEQRERWIVRCDDYTSPTVYKTQEAAERALERIQYRAVCRLPHVVEPKR